jgi:hypothetical protein
MNEPKKEKILSVEMKLDPIDAEVVLKNIGTKVKMFHGLIEDKNVEFDIEIKKSNSIGIVLTILGVAGSDIEGMKTLIDGILLYLRIRQERARIAERKCEIDIKINKFGELKYKKSEKYL